MSGQAFDEQNLEDFQDITERINEALLKISSDRSIKATITELASISGVHRNTIRNRAWPVERLNTIKANRKVEDQGQKKGAEPKSVDVLTAKLEQAELEILYWFKEHRAAKGLYEGSEESVKYLSKSREEYKRKCEELEKELEKLNKEYHRVLDLLNMVGEQ